MFKFLISTFMVCKLFSPLLAVAGGLDACNEALQALRSAARLASFETLETPRKEKQVKKCQELIDKYDINHARCQRIKKEHKFQVEKMQDALADVQAAIFQVELSCNDSLPLGTGNSLKSDYVKLLQGLCSSLKVSTRDMTPEERLAFCNRIHFPGDCSKCLAPR